MRTNRMVIGRQICLAASLVLLAGCSSVPDAVNPVSWYRGVFGDDERKQAEASAKPVPGTDQPFPALGSVPERPAEPSTAADRAKAARTLAADREQARYSDQDIRRQTDDAANRPRRPAGPPAASPAPAPAQSAGRPEAPAPRPRAAPVPVPPPPPRVEMPPLPEASPPPKLSEAPPPPPPGTSEAPPPSAASSGTPAPAASAAPAARPELPLVFGPPPADIAIAQGATRSRTRGRSQSAAVPFEPQPLPAAGRVPSQADLVGSGTKVGTVYFASGSAKLGRDDTAAIRRAVQAYEASGGTIRVVGHASSRTRNLDPLSHEIANLSISLDRANAVAREIVRLGVDPSAVRVSAVSDLQPVNQEVMPSAEAGNRRAEILIEN